MLGFRFVRFNPSHHVLQYRGGRVVREGQGLAFWYYAPTSALVLVPVSSEEAPFIFEESSNDFQRVTLQGKVTYRVKDPKKLAASLNYTLDPLGRSYVSEDPQKLGPRLVNAAQMLAKRELKDLDLRGALSATERFGEKIREGLSASPEVESLGLEILGVSILAVKPTPETAKALEAQTRERILKEADDAIYERRNASIAQERAVKENELSTEIAVETKKREIRETQLEAEAAIQEKQQALEAKALAFQIRSETERRALVEKTADNARLESESRAYALKQVLEAFAHTDPKVIEVLAASGLSSDRLVARAFQELSSRADKVGTLNLSNELLSDLLKRPEG